GCLHGPAAGGSRPQSVLRVPLGRIRDDLHVVLHRDLPAADVGRAADHRAAVTPRHPIPTLLDRTAMSEIQMYSKSWCPYCRMAKRLLAAKNASWQEIDIEDEPQRRREMVERSGRTTVPQIWIADRHVGGYEDLARLDASGELDRLLAPRAIA